MQSTSSHPISLRSILILSPIYAYFIFVRSVTCSFNTLFPNTLSSCASLTVRDAVSFQYIRSYRTVDLHTSSLLQSLRFQMVLLCNRDWEFFSTPLRPDRDWGPTKPSIQWVLGALTVGVKRPRREAYHSPPSNVEVKNAWSYTSNPQYDIMTWCLVKKSPGTTLPLLLPLPLPLLVQEKIKF
jgi:hypothetical protein